MAIVPAPERLRSAWRALSGRLALRGPSTGATRLATKPAAEGSTTVVDAPVEIAPNDPIIAYFEGAAGPVEIETLDLDSPALRSMLAAGIKLVVPLVSQGELVGVLNLGARLSEQDYSSGDRALLANLANQAAPAVRVAQLVQQQQAAAVARERIEQELRVARQIEQALLPKEVPSLAGWRIETYYQPAREVGGDFYDFIGLANGRLGLVIGDVADKGIPAALMMATTRSVLRAAAARLTDPGEVLEQVNELLCPDMPARMFVTCLYAVLDPASGRLRLANAGHSPPYRRSATDVARLRATGLPLGLIPGTRYGEIESELAPGDGLLLYSDGLIEAHDPARAMFGSPRLQRLIEEHGRREGMIHFLLDRLTAFSGPEAEQEDDVTLVAIRRDGAE